jgi:hypothetical protein
MDLAASTIAAIYKSRWQIELFFKWIKQNLKIKSFLGTSKKRRYDTNLGGDELLLAAHACQVPDKICSFPADVKPPYQGNAF